jgi:osmotically-inducible protein OsmY
MLNTELNSFKIDTDVKNGVVVLSGEVGSDTEKDLAGRLAANVQGTQAVTNLLTVKEGHKGGDNPGRQLAQKMNDISVTTGLNIEFAAHKELEATKIDVDTKNGVVVLTGTVKSEAAKDLAVEMAKDYDHVVAVEDNLKVAK